jgi:diguanylate cyclase (GGDEF)-like protein
MQLLLVLKLKKRYIKIHFNYMDDTNNEKTLLSRISELEEQVLSLEKDLIHDSLTGLKTRAFFEEEAQIYFESISNTHSVRRKEWFGFTRISFLFFDIDKFKKINDTYGHAIGDIVLKKVAATINIVLRQGDTAARWGGEEILVSLLGANEDDAHSTALRILDSIQTLRFEEAPDLAVTISCGIATTDEGVPFEELIKRADKALYHAKESGRNTVIRYSELINEETEE